MHKYLQSTYHRIASIDYSCNFFSICLMLQQKYGSRSDAKWKHTLLPRKTERSFRLTKAYNRRKNPELKNHSVEMTFGQIIILCSFKKLIYKVNFVFSLEYCSLGTVPCRLIFRYISVKNIFLSDTN